MSGRTSLYRLFDSEGELLYIGISLSALVRLGQHLGEKAWADQVTRVEIEHHDSRAVALAAERAAIAAERPRHNDIHNDAVLARAALRGDTQHPRALAALYREQCRLAGRKL